MKNKQIDENIYQIVSIAIELLLASTAVANKTVVIVGCILSIQIIVAMQFLQNT